MQSENGAWRTKYQEPMSPLVLGFAGAYFEIGYLGSHRIVAKGPPFLPILPLADSIYPNVHVFVGILSDSATIVVDISNVNIKPDSSTHPFIFYLSELSAENSYVAITSNVTTVTPRKFKEFLIQFNVPYDSLQHFTVALGKALINNQEFEIPSVTFHGDPSITYYPF